jgi:hypothetical protein
LSNDTVNAVIQLQTSSNCVSTGCWQ